MAEENLDTPGASTDDVSALRVLLHNIRGISPVSTTDYVVIPLESEE